MTDSLNAAIIPSGMLLRLIRNKQQIIANYEALLKLSYDTQSSDIISSVIFDEKSHLDLFLSLYTQLFSGEAELKTDLTAAPTDFSQDVRKAVLSEFDTYSLYSNILLNETSQLVKDIFRQALSDENIHSSKFIYLHTKLMSDLFESGEKLI